MQPKRVGKGKKGPLINSETRGGKENQKKGEKMSSKTREGRGPRVSSQKKDRVYKERVEKSPWRKMSGFLSKARRPAEKGDD